ncbi:MAG: nitroreductase family protein [Peptostreptococcaceae bacterium]|nr:nitroreductase family protein [Peptostreptococcaceae bacterium]
MGFSDIKSEPKLRDFKEIMNFRRSVNFFDRSKYLDQKLLEDIINMATYCPSCFNLQPWELIVVKTKDSKEKLYEACKQDKILDAPIIIAVIGEKYGYRRDNPIWDEKIRLNKLDEDSAERTIGYCENRLFTTEEKRAAFAARNSSLFAMSIMYSAKYYGVDSHPMIGFEEDKVKEIFNIDENKIVTMLIALGYRDETKELNERELRYNYDEITTEF